MDTLAGWLEAQIGEDRTFRSNREFADKTGISESTVRRMRHGHYPSMKTIRRMAQALNYPIEDLLKEQSPSKTDAVERLEIVAAQLPEDDQESLLDFAMALLKRRTKHD